MQQQENDMFRKLTLGLAAATAMAMVSLAPTSASAHGWHGFHGGWGHNHAHFRPYVAYNSYGYGGCYVKRAVWTPYGYRYRTVNICY
jgi:hypothetical protein